MKALLFLFLYQLVFINAADSQQASGLLEKGDLSFLKIMTQAVLDSSRIVPGQGIPSFGKNNTNGILIRPGGRDDYPAFWIRDYAMALESGMITAKEQQHMLLLTASTQCDQSWITKGGSLVPLGSIPDHIRIDNSLPIYFPGTYDYEEQGNKEYGMVPPYCDQFYFIHMAYYYVNSSSDMKILYREVNGKKLMDRLEMAFQTPPVKGGDQLVYTDENFRGVDFGFRDAIEITGELSFPSILKYRAANQLADLFEKLQIKSKARNYRQIAKDIKMALPIVFLNEKGMLLASTGKSKQPDVWSTALAVYYNILEGEAAKKAGQALSDAYINGELSNKGNIRHVLTTDDYNETTAWEKTSVEKNRYQNGAYWGTPVGWVSYAISIVNRINAKQLAKDYINDLRENDFRKGNGYGAPYECFFPPGYKQNPLYLATVACPYIVFKSVF